MTTPPPPHRKPADVIADLCRFYEAQNGGQRPPVKWLVAHSSLSQGCAANHRRAYYYTRCNTARPNP